MRRGVGETRGRTLHPEEVPDSLSALIPGSSNACPSPSELCGLPAHPRPPPRNLAFLPCGDAAQQKSITRRKTLLSLVPDRDVFPISMNREDNQFVGDEPVIEVRSMLAVMLYIASGIELPEPLSVHYPGKLDRVAGKGGVEGRIHPGNLLQVHVAEDPPSEAYAAVQFQDMWFWIDRYDTDSKTTFTLLQYLSRLQQARGSLPNAGVLLTIPTN